MNDGIFVGTKTWPSYACDSDVMRKMSLFWCLHKNHQNNEPPAVSSISNTTINLINWSLFQATTSVNAQEKMTRTPRRKTAHVIPTGNSPAGVLTPPDGYLTTWNSASSDGAFLRTVLEGPGKQMTPSEIKQHYPNEFSKYATRTMNSAVQNMKKAMGREVKARVARGQQGKCMNYLF